MWSLKREGEEQDNKLLWAKRIESLQNEETRSAKIYEYR
jgi:hypothetical protein